MTIVMEDLTYEGEVKDGLPHGKGMMKEKDGGTYKGDFFKGKMEGFGESRKNGMEYRGEFKNNK